MDARYISLKDTAAMIRAALKRQFPCTKFSVRGHKYAGGASIDVNWTDGPTAHLVEPTIKAFAGGRFDGSIDMAYSVRHWLLPDGRVAIASNPGTYDQRGSHAPERHWMPEPGAVLVRFECDFVFGNRTESEALMQRVAQRQRERGHEVRVGLSLFGKAEFQGGPEEIDAAYKAARRFMVAGA